jgi:hypothetical protein
MNSKLLFLLGCIPTRLFFVWIAKKYPNKWYSILGAIMAIAWMYLFIFNKRQTGLEVNGGKIWWAKIRPLHALMYAIFAYMAYTQMKLAWVPLLLDVMIGLIAFFTFHYIIEKKSV